MHSSKYQCHNGSMLHIPLTSRGKKSGEWASRQKEDRKSNRTLLKKKRGDSRVESNDSPEIPGRGKTSDIPDLPPKGSARGRTPVDSKTWKNSQLVDQMFGVRCSGWPLTDNLTRSSQWLDRMFGVRCRGWPLADNLAGSEWVDQMFESAVELTIHTVVDS